ncbi:heavy metal-associated domain-containing protein [Ferrovibrio sp.]|uniref:heavy-metal-associated domain-containing protein n=1 Tax=Ferrovibrio sp. TaxID=1917215 RepID=UPI001B51C4AA|nr:heavy metal-associated domain-containing protein [Ferrovibrio sp.]MBP7066548.1 heavy-metal-associated domain-containing protein [Ferrovibrio sp.]
MTDFTVPDMTCGHCETSIRKVVAALPGVDDIIVDRPTKRVSVRGSVSDDVVRKAIENAGFTPQAVSA